MTNSEAPFSYTTKFDGDLFTIRGNDFFDFVGNLKAVDGVNAVRSLLAAIEGTQAPATTEQAVANIQQAIPQAAVVYDQAPPQQPQFAPVAPPQTAPQYAAAAAPLCDHGIARKRIEPGVSKTTGKPYSGFWACQKPRGEQCKPVSF